MILEETLSSPHPISQLIPQRGNLLYKDVDIHETNEKNEPFIQKRLVLSDECSPFHVDLDCGVLINAQEYDFGIIIKPKESYIPIVARKVQSSLQSDGSLILFPRLYHFGTGTIAPEAKEVDMLDVMASKPDSELDWFYFSDGRHNLVFGFRPEEDVKEIGKSFIVLSLLRGGVIHPVLVLKLLPRNSSKSRYVDVTGVSRLSFQHTQHQSPSLTCPYGGGQITAHLLMPKHETADRKSVVHSQGLRLVLDMHGGGGGGVFGAKDFDGLRSALLADALGSSNQHIQQHIQTFRLEGLGWQGVQSVSNLKYHALGSFRNLIRWSVTDNVPTAPGKAAEEGKGETKQSAVDQPELQPSLPGPYFVGQFQVTSQGLRQLVRTLLTALTELHNSGLAVLHLTPDNIALVLDDRQVLVYGPNRSVSLECLRPVLTDLSHAQVVSARQGVEGLTRLKKKWGDWLGDIGKLGGEGCPPPELCIWRKNMPSSSSSFAAVPHPSPFESLPTPPQPTQLSTPSTMNLSFPPLPASPIPPDEEEFDGRVVDSWALGIVLLSVLSPIPPLLLTLPATSPPVHLLPPPVPLEYFYRALADRMRDVRVAVRGNNGFLGSGFSLEHVVGEPE
eukprot:gene40479-49335_t